MTPLLLQSGAARDVLRTILDADLLGRGLTHVVSVRAVALGMEAKWPNRCEAVWDFTLRTVERRAPGALCVQVNEVDFLIAFPNCDPPAAAARALDVARDVLQHFLGKAERIERWVRLARGLDAGLLAPEDGAPSPQAAPEAAEEAHRRDPAKPSPVSPPAFGPPRRPPTAAECGAESDQVSWVAISGDLQRAPMSLRPVWSLRHEAVSSFHLHRRFNPAALGYGKERERFDLAVLDFATGADALGFLQHGTHLQVPIALSTLLLLRPRLQVLDRIRQARRLFRQRVLLELEGVDDGVVQSRLQEVVQTVRPFFKLVLASCTGRPASGPLLRSCGISGAIIDLEAIEEPVTEPALLSRVALARRDMPVVLVYGLQGTQIEDRRLLEAGATHVSSRPGDGTHDAHRIERVGARKAEAAELKRVAHLIDRNI